MKIERAHTGARTGATPAWRPAVRPKPLTAVMERAACQHGEARVRSERAVVGGLLGGVVVQLGPPSGAGAPF